MFSFIFFLVSFSFEYSRLCDITGVHFLAHEDEELVVDISRSGDIVIGDTNPLTHALSNGLEVGHPAPVAHRLILTHTENTVRVRGDDVGQKVQVTPCAKAVDLGLEEAVLLLRPSDLIIFLGDYLLQLPHLHHLWVFLGALLNHQAFAKKLSVALLLPLDVPAAELFDVEKWVSVPPLDTFLAYKFHPLNFGVLCLNMSGEVIVQVVGVVPTVLAAPGHSLLGLGFGLLFNGGLLFNH